MSGNGSMSHCYFSCIDAHAFYSATLFCHGICYGPVSEHQSVCLAIAVYLGSAYTVVRVTKQPDGDCQI